VDKGSDAETKGVKPGDEVLQAGGYKLDRTNLWKFQYLYNALRPQPLIPVTLRSPNAEPRQLELLAKRTEHKRMTDLTNYNEWMDMVRKAEREEQVGRDRFKAYGEELLIWKMHEFDLTDTQVDDAMGKVHKYKTLILDLRGNGGGYLTAAQDIASLWLPNSKVVVQERRGDTVTETLKSRGESPLAGIATVVLIDGGSASASEIVAGALHDHKVAQLVGVKSFGKGSVQQILEIATGGQLKVTVAKWFTPNGINISKEGIQPDTKVEITPADITAGKDLQKDKAFELPEAPEGCCWHTAIDTGGDYRQIYWPGTESIHPLQDCLNLKSRSVGVLISKPK
jgi:carboxyl-terminal processing protease